LKKKIENIQKNKVMNVKYKLLPLSLVLLTCCLNCKKAVQVNPPSNGLVSTTIFNSNATAAAAVTAIYSRMMEGYNTISGQYCISALTGLSGDELQAFSGSDNLFSLLYKNAVNSTAFSFPFWNELYNYIYLANAAIEGLTKSTGVTTDLKQQLVGEAKFVRAFCHFYLVNIYVDVPLVTTTDYRINAIISRTPKLQVYQQIINDLKDAQTLLRDDFVTQVGATTTERVRPNKGAATALLARVYLYTGDDWAKAETEATSVINNSLYSLSPLSNVFLKNSTEAIWQLQPVVPDFNTFDGNTFVLSSGPNTFSQPFFLNTYLQNAFETGDYRKINWIGADSSTGQTYYYPYKYKVWDYGQPVTEYLMVLRLAEQYLIRAEARAQLDKISEAQSDLNVIRNRAGLLNTTANDKPSLLTAIEHERQVELFTEWGHRWLDLKRTQRVNAVMSIITPQKGGVWTTNWQLYPIPLSELQADPNLIQNPGYQ